MFQISDWSPALIGAAVGAVVSVIAQIGARRWRIAQARRALRLDLGLLLRHIDASLASLQIGADAPVYILAARLRYARFEDLMLTRERLELVEALHEQERARLLIASIRNSDILLEEIAARIDGQTPEGRRGALDQALVNLRILRETIVRLNLDTVATAPQVSASLAADVQRSLREKALHATSVERP
jgi:hypothetical protein